LNAELILREPLGERSFAATDFPLSIGGEGSTVLVPARTSEPLAWIAQHDGQLFVQPSTEEAVVLHNGSRIMGSTWLRGGDVLDVGGGRLKLRVDGGRRLLELLSGGADNVTAPPMVVASESVAGEGANEDERIDAVAFRSQAARATVQGLSMRRVAIACAAVVLALAAALVFTSTPVEVVIDPVPQTVSFEGRWPGLRLGSSHLLRPGNYTLVAGREGYKVLRVPVIVGSDSGQVLRYRLAPLPGHLEIELPVPGTVNIDGRAAGKVPGEFELAAGEHEIVINTERYLDYTDRVKVAGFGKRQQLAPKLTPAWAVVSISTEPAGAAVRVAGELRGTTPLELELMAGSYPVELLHAGFKPWVSDVQVKANEPLTIGPVKLGLPDGRLAVRSRPAGATVTIGGAYRGRTPLDVDVRPDLKQLVSIARDGYEPASRQTTVGAGKSATLEFTLAPILGEVIVQANPKDAELLVDGDSRGMANQTLRLPATRHSIEIRRPGYATYRTSVTPRPGLPQSVEVTLLEGVAPRNAATQEEGKPGTGAESAPAPVELVALQPMLRTKSGQELKLAPAGEFTMGSPRREAGRRANESQRQVRLERRFYVATREVTNAEYRRFRAEHRSGFILQTTLELDRAPVVNVSWQEAVAYCNWLSEEEGLTPAYEMKGGSFVPVTPITNGYRLPTEAEWEWIARRAGAGLRKYPWGDSLPVPRGAGNYADRSAQALLPTVLTDYDDGYPVTAPVGSFTANPGGYFDLGGNVAEWTHDLYTVQPRSEAAAVDPATNDQGTLHVIRGSSWKSAAVTELRLAYRDYGEGRRNDLGFRIARYAQ
jgi:formylglycine-generating enzyme required for sulfatase activity